MSTQIQELIRQLRKAEDRRHLESIHAITVLEQNMVGSGPPAAMDPSIGDTAATSVQVSPEPQSNTASNVNRVVAVLSEDESLSVGDIVKRTGLEEEKVRASLYARSMRKKVRKERVNKRMEFRLIPEGDRQSDQASKSGAGTSVPEHICRVLKEHPEGLPRKLICAELPSLKPATISASLLRLKRSSRITHDASTGRYLLLTAE